jgi:hypothetical protein
VERTGRFHVLIGKFLKFTALMAGLFGLVQTTTLGQDLAVQVETSRAVTQAFLLSLKDELNQVIQASGPVGAIDICRYRAPTLTAKFSKEYGGRVARTSLKVRNPANTPDKWEKDVLEQFERRKRKGEDPAKIDYHEVVEHDGKPQFRYMKAIPAGEVCLTCHGSKIDPSVAKQINKLYPTDRATGFKQGDLRGAFTLMRPL